MLDDGTHDALVIDAADKDDDGCFDVELTLTTGDRKGEVVAIRTNAWSGDPIELLGVPATITVTDGEPHVVFEP